MYRSFLNLALKTALKSVDFSRSYRQKISWLLLWLTVYTCTLPVQYGIRGRKLPWFVRPLIVKCFIITANESNNISNTNTPLRMRHRPDAMAMRRVSGSKFCTLSLRRIQLQRLQLCSYVQIDAAHVEAATTARRCVKFGRDLIACSVVIVGDKHARWSMLGDTSPR